VLRRVARGIGLVLQRAGLEAAVVLRALLDVGLAEELGGDDVRALATGPNVVACVRLPSSSALGIREPTCVSAATAVPLPTKRR
jgi:hypothetical protein